MDKRVPSEPPVDINLDFSEFLDLTKVIKMLYGRDVAERFFTRNMRECYNIDNESLSNLRKGFK